MANNCTIVTYVKGKCNPQYLSYVSAVRSRGFRDEQKDDDGDSV